MSVITDVRSGLALPAAATHLNPLPDRDPLPRPAVKPFDKPAALKKIGTITAQNLYALDWDAVGMPAWCGPEEADFWLETVLVWASGVQEAAILDAMEKYEPPADRTLPALAERFKGYRRQHPVALVGPLAALFGPVALLQAIADGTFEHAGTNFAWQGRNVVLNMVRGCWERVVPYLTAAEKDTLRAWVKPKLVPADWPKASNDKSAPAYFLAAMLGMSDEIWDLAGAWVPATNQYGFTQHGPFYVLLGLTDGRFAERVRTLKLTLHDAFMMRAWLAHTGLDGLDYATEQVKQHRYNDAPLVTELSAVADPAIARVMLSVKLTSRHPAAAREWLETHVGSAVAGMIPLATDRGRTGAAAVEYLTDAAKRGYGWVIERELAGQPAAVVGRVTRAVLTRPERPTDEHTPDTEPAWVGEIADKPFAGKPPKWADPATLPPILVDGKRLGVHRVERLLAELANVPAKNVATFAAAVRQHASPDSRDAFVAEVFERYLKERSPQSEGWVLTAIGRVGGDAAVATLVPRLRRWPGGGGTTRIRAGLTAMRHVGTDFALVQLGRLGATLSNVRLRNHATKELAAAAEDRGLTPDQLADRTVPDAGLANGGRLFDYGPRQFRLALGPTGAVLKDAAGKSHTAPPAPRKSDDPVLVAEARAAWKLAKGQVAEVMAGVVGRLEHGLVHSRRWHTGEFDQYLMKHPLVGGVTQRLVWVWFRADGTPGGTFRVTAEGEVVGPDDAPTAIAGPVGLAHPVHMPNSVGAWRTVFADYEIVSPFEQLTRPVTAPTDGPEETRFNAANVSWRQIAAGAKANGWLRRGDTLNRTFPTAGLTAVVAVKGWDKLAIGGCVFRPTKEGAMAYATDDAVPGAAVDPVVRCEVLADLARWQASAG